ncbi:MAG: flagellar biosynthetic protein FliO [Pseudomonadota bacterium]
MITKKITRKGTRVIYIISLLTFFMLSSVSFAAVKVKNISQTGSGTSGTIKIELNGKYSDANVKTSYTADRVDFTLSNAFVLPVKRIFKSSSPKSSITKIEANQIPGKSVRVSVYFKGVPMDVIKKTAELTSDGGFVVFNYNTSLNAPAAPAPQPAKTQAASEAATAKAIEDNGEDTDKTAAVKTVDNKEVVSAKAKTWGMATVWKFVKFIFLIALVFVCLFAVFYLFRRYSSGVKKAVSPAASHIGNIRVITSHELAHGKTLHVIEVLGEKLLIASGKDSITMLAKLGTTASDEDSNSIMRSRLKDQLKNV